MKIQFLLFSPIINKGNTCYASSILQVLSVLSLSQNNVLLEWNSLSLMLCAVSLNLAVKKNPKPVEPSNFLWVLRRAQEEHFLIVIPSKM